MRANDPQPETPGFDAARAERFAERVVEVLNGGGLALMLSIGHRAGLFDVMGYLEHATSAEIAEAAGLRERYVREWLGSMVTGAIVDYDPEQRCYRLPPEHAASLTREARPRNLAATAQWIPLLAGVEDEVLACFERGGGVHSHSFGRFQEVMAEQSDQTTVSALRDHILPLVPGAPAALETGADVLDVGCGVGRALNRLAHDFPKSRFTGYDCSEEAVALALADAEAHALPNVHFEERDVARLEEVEAYHLVTAFDAVHDQAHPGAVLAGMYRALRPGGALLMQEVHATSRLERDRDHPLAPFLYTVSCLHCTTVSLAEDGDGLGAMWGAERALQMLADAGFTDARVHTLPHDPINQYFVAHRPA